MSFRFFLLFLFFTISPLFAQSTSPTCMQINQTEKSKFFKRGPQALIAGVRVLPVFKDEEKKRFLGFKIDQILDDSLIKSGMIKEGDIILNINGEPIGRPEHFMKAWETAKKASKITLEIQRDTEKLAYHWCVVAQ
jgi:type II secretory pathway component PulC